MAMHVACTAALSFSIDRDTQLFDQLFTHPFLGGLIDGPWLLRAKYFIPWVVSPEDLNEYWFVPRAMFWGARLGGMLVALGFVSFFVSGFYYAGAPA